MAAGKTNREIAAHWSSATTRSAATSRTSSPSSACRHARPRPRSHSSTISSDAPRGTNGPCSAYCGLVQPCDGSLAGRRYHRDRASKRRERAPRPRDGHDGRLGRASRAVPHRRGRALKWPRTNTTTTRSSWARAVLDRRRRCSWRARATRCSSSTRRLQRHDLDAPHPPAGSRRCSVGACSIGFWKRDAPRSTRTRSTSASQSLGHPRAPRPASRTPRGGRCWTSCSWTPRPRRGRRSGRGSPSSNSSSRTDTPASAAKARAVAPSPSAPA